MSGILLNFVGVTAVSVPGAPTIGTVTTSGSTASVPFTAPASNGGSPITSYTATSSPGGITGTLSQAGSGTITVNNLQGGTAYTFTVTATNAIGTGPASAASNSVTPTLSATYLVVAGGGSGGNNIGSDVYASGGGGAGGYLSGTFTPSIGTNYTITVGGGGTTPSAGTNSSGFSQTATGGGCGIPVGGSTKNGGSGGGGGDTL